MIAPALTSASSLEVDVAAVLAAPDRAGAAKGRLLARLAAGTAAQNADTLVDVLAAAQRVLVREGR